MTELFENLSQDTKEMISSYIDMTLVAVEPMKIPILVNDFIKALGTEDMQNFADFYFRLKMEELRNGDNYNQREEQFR